MSTPIRRWRRWVAALALCAAGSAGALQACVEPSAPKPLSRDGRRPAVRLIFVTNLAGALEPCGCTPDQLGGVDHLGALVASSRHEVPAVALLAVGSTLFGDGSLQGESATQDRWKAETIAGALGSMDLTAWAPGHGDFADGVAELTRLGALTKAQLLATNVQGAPTRPSAVVELGRVRLGLVGVSEPRRPEDRLADGVTTTSEAELAERLRGAVRQTTAQGASLLVGLVAAPRGSALRLAEAVPELDVLAVADPAGAGTLDDDQLLPVLIGPTLVVQGPNHGQRSIVVDVLLADPSATADGPGGGRLRDLGGVARAEEVGAVSRRIRELELRIEDWKRSSSVSATDLAARSRDLDELRRRRAELEQSSPPEPGTSGFRYLVREVRESLGTDAPVAERMTAYYRRVNDHNRETLAGRLPPPLRDGQQRFVGQDACTSTCHVPARRFCDTRPHAKAYESLRKQFKEYNLDCVGCHVTGYERPGGSTVTHNELLRDVQCEECHGAGSEHVARPNDPGLTTRKPAPGFCAERCHVPPHVATFDEAGKLPLVLGPGHGGS